MTRSRAVAWTLINACSGAILGVILRSDRARYPPLAFLALLMLALALWGMIDCGVRAWRGPS